MRPFPLLKSALLSAAVLALALAASPGLAREAKAKETGMVAAAHPLAVEAGVSVLRRGGSAVDAAVAVQAALGLVEPQSSGIGGGAFITYYDARTRKVTAYNGRGRDQRTVHRRARRRGHAAHGPEGSRSPGLEGPLHRG